MGQCRDKYKAWVENLIKLASLQTSFVTMDEALKVRCAAADAVRAAVRPDGRVSRLDSVALGECAGIGALRVVVVA